MKGLFKVDIAVELHKYRTETNPHGRKQYLKGVGECPDDEYVFLAPYFIPDLKPAEPVIENVQLEEIDSTTINLDDYKTEKVNEVVESEEIEKETEKEIEVKVKEEIKAVESPKNKMTTSKKVK
jgi:hypothetical protein